jgi:trigger factor
MLEETVNGLLNEKLFGYLDDQKIGFFGSPLIADDAEPIDFNAKSQADYTFVFDLGLKPVFDLQYKLEDPIEVLVPMIDQAGLDEDIIRYRRVFGEEVPVSNGQVEENDRVKVSLQKMNENGTPEDHSEETVIDLERVQGEARDLLKGLKDGANLDADLEKFLGYERSVILKNTLHIEEDPVPGQPLQYRVTILSINRPQHTALTGEQLTRFTGKQMEDETEFRQFLEKREKDNLDTKSADMKKLVVRKTLLDANPFEIPESFLLKWVNQQRDKKIDEGTREASHLFRDAKWSLLLSRISTAESLEVTEKDVQR